jgi:prevent-host-death family protein
LTKVAPDAYYVAMRATGIKDLKNRLSYYMREVKKGENILITERKNIIATIVPVDRSDTDNTLLSLVKEGFAVWKGGKPAGARKPFKVKGKTISEIVLEDRR